MNNEAATSKKQTHAFCRNGKHVSALTSLDGQLLCNLQPSEWILPDSQTKANSSSNSTASPNAAHCFRQATPPPDVHSPDGHCVTQFRPLSLPTSQQNKMKLILLDWPKSSLFFFSTRQLQQHLVAYNFIQNNFLRLYYDSCHISVH